MNVVTYLLSKKGQNNGNDIASFLLGKDTGSGSRLPKGYKEVEYIESTGTQYIETNVVPNHNAKIILDFCYTSNTTNTQLFGSRLSWNSRGFYVGTKSNVLGNMYWMEFGSRYRETGLPMSDTNRHIINYSKTIIIDDVTYYTYPSTSFTGYQNIVLFGSWEGEQGKIVPSCSRLYSCQIFNGNTILRDYVPCYRKNDNVIGLYDLTNDVFYENGGTGTFLKGGDV